MWISTDFGLLKVMTHESGLYLSRVSRMEHTSDREMGLMGEDKECLENAQASISSCQLLHLMLGIENL